MHRQMNKIQHYFLDANPFKDVNSLSKLIDENLYLTTNKDIAVLNKPPGFILSSKTKDTKNFIDILKQNIKIKLNWSNALRIPIVTDDQAGIFMYASSHDAFESARKTMISIFPSKHLTFLNFYGISTHIPLEMKGKEVFHVSYKNVQNDIFYFEEINPSHNSFKSNKVITYQIEHEVVDTNRSLDVALIKYQTGWHFGDGVLFYSMKNLFPILGDCKYSSRVKSIMGKPMLVNIDPNDVKYETKELNERVLQCLNLNKYILEMVPLHLQLYEIELEKKSKKQRTFFKIQVPIQPYFSQTLNNLCLKIPQI